jgi:hypothetical protein
MIGSPDPVWSEKAAPLGEQADQLQKKAADLSMEMNWSDHLT